MDCLTKENIEDWLKYRKDDDKFCPSCLNLLQKVCERQPNPQNPLNGTYYICTNIMCLDERKYDENGKEVTEVEYYDPDGSTPTYSG